MFIASRFESELFRRYVILAAALALLLAVSPVSAVPALKVGSTASYTLAGKLQASQSCTSDPIGYASQACTGVSSISEFPVTILDQYNCKGQGINDPFVGLECRFIPANLTVTDEYWTAELCFRTHSSGLKFLVHFHSDGNLSLLRLWLYLHERNCPCEPCSPTSDAELFPGQCWGDSWLEC